MERRQLIMIATPSTIGALAIIVLWSVTPVSISAQREFDFEQLQQVIIWESDHTHVELIFETRKHTIRYDGIMATIRYNKHADTAHPAITVYGSGYHLRIDFETISERDRAFTGFVNLDPNAKRKIVYERKE